MKRFAVFLLASLAGCGLPNESVLPPLCTPESFKGPENELVDELTDCWWTAFQDSTLNELMDEALAQNPDLWIACERIQEARAIEGIAFSPLLPSITLAPSYSKEGRLFNPNNVTGGDIPGLALTRVFPETASFPLNLSYELDFWCKYRYGDKAARQRLLASQFGFQSTVNILTSEVARVYFTLRTFDEEIGYLSSAVDVRKALVEINQERVSRGLDPEVDLERSRLELLLAEADLVDAERLRSLAENELAVLLGREASTFCISLGSLPEVHVNVCAGLPSELLLRRPDLNEQYSRIKASLYEVGVANANFFPSISITGALGTVSPVLSSWFTWQSRYWAIAFGAVQQIFDGGRLINEKRAALSRFHQQKGIYQKAVFTAFKEVEDALSEVHYRHIQLLVQESAVFHATETAHLARQQFDGGLINYLQVADAEKTELETKRRAIQLKGARFFASVALIKALGGSPLSNCETNL